MMLMAVALGTVTTISCGSDDNPTPTPQPPTPSQKSLVGTWTYNFSSGYCEMTFNADGTGSYFEFDHGQIESNHQFTYTYKDNIVTIYYDNGKKDESVITWQNDNIFKANFDEDETWVKKGSSINNNNNISDNNYSIVGTWRYYFGKDGYEQYTFKADGTGSRYEYDPLDGGMHSQHTFTYTISNNTVTIRNDKGEVESSTITWITKDKFTAHFDENETWVRQ